MEQEEIAIEELKTLQKIIMHHEGLAFRVKGWYVVVMGALAIASYHEQIIGLTWPKFLTIGLVIYFGFFYWILFHRDVVSLAIGRVHKVERALRFLREGSIFDGPAVGRSLAHPTLSAHKSEEPRWQRRWRIIRKDEQILVPAIVAIVLLAALTWFVPSAAPTTKPPTPTPPVAVSPTAIPSPATVVPNPPAAIPNLPSTVISGIQSIASLWEIGALCLIIGGVAILFVSRGRSKPLMTIGALSMLAGAGWHVITIKKIDFEKLINIEKAEIDWARTAGETGGSQIFVLNRSMQPATKNDQGRFGAQMLGTVSNFPIGDAEVENAPGSKEALSAICTAWKKRANGDALVLIIGATDRLPLEGPMRLRYDANAGLAVARASAVRDYLTSKCWQPKTGVAVPVNVLLLSSGPEHTPPFLNKRYRIEPDGVPVDRRVDVLALSTYKEPNPATHKMPNSSAKAVHGNDTVAVDEPQTSSFHPAAQPQQ